MHILLYIYDNCFSKAFQKSKEGKNKLHFSEWQETTKYLDRQSKSDRNPLGNKKMVNMECLVWLTGGWGGGGRPSQELHFNDSLLLQKWWLLRNTI